MFPTGFEYTLASGRLFCPFDVFMAECSKLVGRPLFDIELTSEPVVDEIKAAVEKKLLEAINDN